MSRDPYRSSGEFYPPRGGQRWDTERFERERIRSGGGEREIYEERDSRFLGPPRQRVRERSVDEIYERDRRGPRVFEDERVERRVVYDDEPRFERERRESRPTVTIEKEREREVYRDERDRPPARPAFLRRQSSLDTFDRKPMTRYVERDIREEREEYDRYDARPGPLIPVPIPRTRALPPPRRYERDYYDEIEIAEPDYYGDDYYRGYPERIREREIIRTKRRSRSRESKSESKSHRSSSRASSSSSSSSVSTTTISVKPEFPKKGKTRMPARLVSKRAITDLGYVFEEEGDVIVIQKALGRENIDEVIKLSEDYKSSEEKVEIKVSGGRSEAGTFVEERRQEVFTIPPPPPANLEVVRDTKIIETHHDHSPARSAIVIDAHHPDTTIVEKREYIERSDAIPVGPLALTVQPERHRSKDERAIRAEIKALEAEKEALRAEKRAERELRKADRIRREGRSSESELVLYESDRYGRPAEEFTVVRRERIEEPEGGVRIEKDKKVPPPKLVRAMLATLT